MTILSMNLNLLANSKSKLKSLSSNFLRVLSPVTTAYGKIQVHTPRLVGDLKHNKLMFLIQHSLKGSCNYSLLSITGNSWKLDNLYHPFSVLDHSLSASCNGLSLWLRHIDARPREALWNPTTNEIKTLPQSHVPCPRYSTNTHFYYDTYGFGFDLASQDYKVIRFLQFRCPDYPFPRVDLLVELYSLKTDSWKEITFPRFGFPRLCCVYINGITYWPTSGRSDDFILSFDFTNEKFTYIPLPETDKIKTFRNCDLVEFDGSLAALVYEEPCRTEKRPFTLEIWVWNNDESSWTRVSTVVDFPAGVDKAVGLFKNDKLFLQGFDSELMLFDCATRKVENLGIHADCWDIFPYVGSSVPLDGKSSERC